jgi:Initiator Rep protein, WH2/Initiator Replication protein, WH1
MKTISRTIEQKTNYFGFPKPGEFIEMTGAHSLEAADRAIFNILYQFAHDSGKVLNPAAEWEIPLSTLRQAFSKHENNGRLRQSLERLRSVMANIHYIDENDEPRVIITGLFDFFDIPAREMTKRPTLRYGLPRKVIPILESSGRWGRIRAEIVCSMTSKYSIALYELVQLKAGLEKCVETVAPDRLRDLLGVPPGNYERLDNLLHKVIEPAVLQVNGLSDMGVSIQPRRKHARSGVESFDIAWWRKNDKEEMLAAVKERNRSKVGRTARLKGTVEIVMPRVPLLSQG